MITAIYQECISESTTEQVNVVTLQDVEISEVTCLDGDTDIPCVADQRGNWNDPVFSARAHFRVHFGTNRRCVRISYSRTDVVTHCGTDHRCLHVTGHGTNREFPPPPLQKFSRILEQFVELERLVPTDWLWQGSSSRRNWWLHNTQRMCQSGKIVPQERISEIIFQTYLCRVGCHSDKHFQPRPNPATNRKPYFQWSCRWFEMKWQSCETFSDNAGSDWRSSWVWYLWA